MNNCVECGKPTSHTVINLSGGIRVCIECFFNESIPNPTSRQVPNFEKLERKRQKAIEARAQEIIKKHGPAIPELEGPDEPIERGND